MDVWSLEKCGFDAGEAVGDGNRFLCANGYMGLRGAPEEAGRDLYAAVTLAGVYDRNGQAWREPVNAPNALYLRLFFNGKALALGETRPIKHRQRLDYRCGLFSRDTLFDPVRVESERFVSMAEHSLLADRYRMQVIQDGEITLQAGISTDLWDINGPHFKGFDFRPGPALQVRAVTCEKGIEVAAAQCLRTDFETLERLEQRPEGLFRMLTCPVKKGQILTVEVFAAVCTSQEGKDPAETARQSCLRARERGFEECLKAHRDAWEDIWACSEVTLEGNGEAARDLHASQYHLNCIAPRHAQDLSIPARGLSGQTYKGAIFWDAEIFCLPMFVFTQPEIARSLLRYRIETLPGALKKAREYGYRGAFYAWESQEGGQEGCTDFNVVDVFTHRPVRTYFRDRQIHISADVVYALWQYSVWTGDRTLLEEGGARVILECARFYLSRANAHLDRTEVDYADVIGPDEYHERVCNNAFTNRMILYCIESALSLREVFGDKKAWFSSLLKEMDYERELPLLEELCGRLRGPKTREGVIEQFDGYFALEDCSLDAVRARLRDDREYWGGDHGVAGTTQIIKQADVLALMALLPEAFEDEEVEKNWQYYEPRTEHGSSLSACMYALTACRLGLLDEAWRLFRRTAGIDVTGGGKQWAGEIYIGGTHPASNGGAWMIAALGFAGLRMSNGRPEIHPRLPDQLTRLTFPVIAGGKKWTVDITRDGGSILPS